MFIAEHYGAPAMLMALLLGMSLHSHVEPNTPLGNGLDYVAKRILRVGVALLGLRLTFSDIATWGIWPVVAVATLVISTIVFGVLLSRSLGIRARFGLLTGGSVAICGASAALAIASVLPKDPKLERDTLFTVVVVTILSTIAMITYPIILHSFGFDEHTSGAIVGATIHDVAQAVGAGYSISLQSGDTATYVKLLRVSTLPIVLFGLVLAFGSKAGTASRFPWFVLGFFALVLINSAEIIPKSIHILLIDTSKWLLVAAIAALGTKTSLKELASVKKRYIVILIAETTFIFTAAVLLWNVVFV